jgi:hypothetical protein
MQHNHMRHHQAEEQVLQLDVGLVQAEETTALSHPLRRPFDPSQRL